MKCMCGEELIFLAVLSPDVCFGCVYYNKTVMVKHKIWQLFTDEELKGYCKGKWAEKFIEETT